MGRYLRGRLVTAIPVFFGITLIVFLLLHLAPGSIVDLAGEGSARAAGQAARVEAYLGLDRSLPAQYAAWLLDLLRGDLGTSYASGKPVSALIAQRVVPSLLLTGTGVLLAVGIALPLGVLAAWKPRSGWDKAASALSLVSFGVPGFFLCLAGIFLFSVVLGWLPSHGMYASGSFSGLGDLMRHLVLPAGVVCVSGLGGLIKQTRSACLEALGEDYITTARAKGLNDRAVMVRHAFRGALIPVLTTVLTHIPHIIGGAGVRLAGHGKSAVFRHSQPGLSGRHGGDGGHCPGGAADQSAVGRDLRPGRPQSAVCRGVQPWIGGGRFMGPGSGCGGTGGPWSVLPFSWPRRCWWCCCRP